MAELMKQCADKAELIICEHVAQGAEVEVLLVNDELAVDYGLCGACGAQKEPDGVPFVPICRGCGQHSGIPATMPTPGKWQLAVVVN